jgi:hypothetical protein
MAEPRDKANLKRTTKACASSMLKNINKTVRDIEALIQDEMASAQHAWTDGGRERAYSAIRKRLGLLEQGLAGTLEKLAKTAALSGNEEAIRQVGDGAVTAFSEEHLAEYISRINPSNAPSLAQVYTKSMEASVVTALRQTAMSVYTRAAASGMTMNEQARAFQAEWSLRVRDANPYRFVDKAGRKWENARYIQMLTRTTAQRVETAAFCDSMLSDGFPLARISNDSGNDCDVCAQWEGRLIDLTPGHKLGSGTYTLQEAREAGLFHPNCTHRLEYVSVLEIPDAIWAKVKDKIGKPGAWKDNPSVTNPDFMSVGKQAQHTKQVKAAAQKRAQEDGYAIVRQQLEDKGATLDESLADLDPKLLNLNMNRLNDLIDKYPIVKDYIKNYGIEIKTVDFKEPKALAGVNRFNDGESVTLVLSRKAYVNYERYLIEKRMLIGIGWLTPCKKRNYPVYDITHEFGHIIQNILVNEELKNSEKNKKSNTPPLSFGSIVNKHKEELLSRMKRIEGNISDANLASYTSGRSDHNSLEFFAEAFANAECGEAKEMGKAMKGFLRRRLK